ncbi:MAG TPA: SMR family transporter [Limnochordales bacterium]|nr:SMR family transporter [Limnochordales bacterium]
MTLATFSLVIFSVAMGVAGQLFMKRGMLAHPNLQLEASALLRALLQPAVLVGFACYGVASISWLMVLSRVPLSVAYPMLSLGYAAVAVLSWYFFGEPLSPVKLAGILAILAGIVLLSRA